MTAMRVTKYAAGKRPKRRLRIVQPVETTVLHPLVRAAVKASGQPASHIEVVADDQVVIHNNADWR